MALLVQPALQASWCGVPFVLYCLCGTLVSGLYGLIVDIRAQLTFGGAFLGSGLG